MVDQYKPFKGTASRRFLVHPLIAAVIGFSLVAGACYLLVKNEIDTIKLIRLAEEGRRSVASIASAQPVDVQYEGKLVHMSGEVKAEERLVDPLFQVSVNAVALKRVTEMYQWVEVEKNSDKQTDKTELTYEPKWSEDWHDPGRFKQPKGHDNPVFPFKSEVIKATNIRVGDYLLSALLVNMMVSNEQAFFTPLEINEVVAPPKEEPEPEYICTCVESRICNGHEALGTKAMLSQQIAAFYKNIKDYRPAQWSCTLNLEKQPAQGDLTAGFERMVDGFYKVTSLQAPEIGDIRVRYKVINPMVVTIMGKSQQGIIGVYQGVYGQLASIVPGTVAVETLLKPEQEPNISMVWTVRIMLACMIFIGLALVIGPLSIVMASVPVIGKLLGLMSKPILALVALAVPCGITAQFWWIYRPDMAHILAGSTVFLIIIALVLLWRRRPVVVTDDEMSSLA